MVRSCGPDVPPHENPGVQLGLAMGLAGLEGRDKVTILSSPKIADFGAWAEQLIAESTGKDGKGLIPIDGEPLADPALYGNDRFFIDIRTEGENDAAHDDRLAALEEAGHPVVRIVMKSIDHIGQEFFRFEMATAVAGAVLGINPFDQPDVEAAKIKTRELTAAFEKTGALPAEKPVMSSAQADLYTDDANAAALRKAGADGDLGSWLKAHLARSGAGDYVALLAYIERDAPHIDALQQMRLAVRDKRHVATCAEFGPRFLHSTGQAYKGGPDSGVFLQITADDARDLAGARPEGELRRDQGRAGARRFRRADRTRPPRPARASQGRSQGRTEDARCRDHRGAELDERFHETFRFRALRPHPEEQALARRAKACVSKDGRLRGRRLWPSFETHRSRDAPQDEGHGGFRYDKNFGNAVLGVSKMQLGMIGLGRMGGNIVRRLMKHGHTTVVYDKDPKAVAAIAADGALGAGALEDFVAKLEKPRTAWVMLPAGKITEATIDALSTTDGGWRRHHRWRQHLLAGRRAPRQGSEAAGHPLCRRRHLRRRLGHRPRLLHDDRRRQGSG